MSEVKQGKSADYYEGVADGIKEHAYTRDGTVYVGTTGATLAEALDAVEATRRDAAGDDKPEPEKKPEPPPAPGKKDDGENTPVPQKATKADDEDDEDGNAADNATPRRPAAPPPRGRR